MPAFFPRHIVVFCYYQIIWNYCASRNHKIFTIFISELHVPVDQLVRFALSNQTDDQTLPHIHVR